MVKLLMNLTWLGNRSQSYYVTVARMIKISCDNANNCTLEVMSWLGNFTCSMSVKIQLFNTYCSPMYTVQLWWNHTVASFHRLNVAYNNVDCLDDHDSVVHLVCLQNVESQIVKLSFIT